MKRITSLLVCLTVIAFVGCASVTHPANSPAASPTIASHAASDVTPDPAQPAASDTQPVDLLARALTSPTFVDHANRALAIAGSDDPEFSQCVMFQLALGQELKAKPLLTAPTLAIVTADPSCPLCLLAAKRKDIAQLQSGAVASQLAAIKARVHDIETRAEIACAPLFADEKATLLRLAGIVAPLIPK